MANIMWKSSQNRWQCWFSQSNLTNIIQIIFNCGLTAWKPWWRHHMNNFPLYWSFVRGIHRSPVDFPHKGQWRRALIYSSICAWTNGWANSPDTGDLRRHGAHYGVIVMGIKIGMTHSGCDNIIKVQRYHAFVAILDLCQHCDYWSN